MAELPSLEEECFFIAPIGAEGSPERKRSDGVLNFIVSAAAKEVGLTAVRADKIAEPGQITLQVIEHVLGAKAAVVDLSGLNPNVFYEMAIRHTARLPVALIADKGCPLPFDIAQMRTIFFDHTDLESADECRKAIAAQLKEALSGAVDSPIATTVDVQAMQSGSVAERNIAELVTTVESMARSQRSMEEMVERFMDRDRDDIAPDAIADLASWLRRLQLLSVDQETPELDDIIAGLERPVRYLEAHVDDPNGPGRRRPSTRSRVTSKSDVASRSRRWVAEIEVSITRLQKALREAEASGDPETIERTRSALKARESQLDRERTR